MNKLLDITITATRRPELLDVTLRSFTKYLFRPEIPTRIIINVDPAGHSIDSSAVVAVCHRYSDSVFSRCPISAHFPSAFKWVWSQAEAPFVFHLEEDWELTRSIDLLEMMEVMNRNKDVAILRLPYRPVTDRSKNWSVFFPWNGEFFECPSESKGSLGFCGHPSLIRYDFVVQAASNLNTASNPEKQIKWRNPLMGPLLDRYRFGVFSERDQPAAIRDIGRNWMIQHGWRKVGVNKEQFTEWQKVSSGERR